MRQENSENRWLIRAMRTQFEIVNFFGFGNDTERGDRPGSFLDGRIDRVEVGVQ